MEKDPEAAIKRNYYIAKLALCGIFLYFCTLKKATQTYDSRTTNGYGTHYQRHDKG